MAGAVKAAPARLFQPLQEQAYGDNSVPITIPGKTKPLHPGGLAPTEGSHGEEGPAFTMRGGPFPLKVSHL